MTRARSLSQLANSSVFTVATNNRVGIGSEVPTAKLDVDGTLNVSGNATIGGVATYEDVTNVDSVGIITARSTIDAKGDISIADKIIHTGDTNTAIRFPAADTVTIETGGTERLRVNSSGHLGIGAANNTSYDTNAQNLLLASSGNTGMTIRSAGATPFAMIHFADGTSGVAQQRAGRILYQHDGNNMSFHTDNTERFRIDGSGNIGIGNADPGALLHVSSSNNGVIRTGGDNAGTTGFEINYSNSSFTTTTLKTNYRATNANATLRIDTGTFVVATGPSNGEKLRVDASGRLLVGTSTSRSIGAGAAYPARLQVESSGFTNTSFTQNSNDIYGPEVNLGKSRGTSAGGATIVQSGDQLGIIQFAGADGTDLETNAAAIECRVDGTPGSNDMPGRLLFLTTADSQSNPTERMRIDSAGRLLLNGGTDVRMELGTTGTSGTNDRNHIRADGSNLKFNTCSGGLHIFEQNGTERMRIDSNGNIGVNQTSVNSLRKMEITQPSGYSGALRIQSELSSGNPGYIEWFSGASQYKIGINHATDALKFLRNNAELMRIDSSGNMGLGNSNPAAGASGGSNRILNIASGLSSGVSHITFGDSNAVGKIESVNGNGTIAINATTAVIIGTSGSSTERMRINSSGNMGLGTDSPSSSNGGRFIHIHNPGTDTNRPSEIVFTNGVTGTTGAVGGTITYYQDNLYTWNFEAKDLIFGTNATERMRIKSSGTLMLGKTTTNAGDVGTFIDKDGLSFFSVASSGGTNTLHVFSTTAGAYRFYVGLNGTINATNTTISAISDQRLKENIRDLDAGLAEILSLQPRRFDWKTGKGKDIQNDQGFVAQEFEQVFPEMVDEWIDPAPEGEDPYKSVRADLIPVLVNAIKEQQTMITDLQSRLSALEG